MSDTKISALPSGSPAQASDAVPVVRAGANYQVPASTIAALYSLGYTAENVAHKDAANGYPSLDATGKVPVTEIPGNTNVNAQGSSVAAYTAVLTDAGNLVTMSDASASTFTVPPNSGVAFPVGTVLSVCQLGAGQITLTPGSGVTINTPSSLLSRTQYSVVTLVQVAANVWVAGGDLQ